MVGTNQKRKWIIFNETEGVLYLGARNKIDSDLVKGFFNVMTIVWFKYLVDDVWEIDDFFNDERLEKEEMWTP